MRATTFIFSSGTLPGESVPILNFTGLFVIYVPFSYNLFMPKKREKSSCELPDICFSKQLNQNRHYRFQNNYIWKGIKARKYKPEGEGWHGIVRHSLIGSRGEITQFHLRYFEIEPDGYSSFEKHRHEHVVIGVRGKGRARLGKRNIDLNYLDVLYIKPDEPHRLYNPFKEPFGFFCIVNAKRDRPKPIKE